MQRKVPCRFNLYVIAISTAHTMELVFNALLDDFVGRGLFWLSGCRIVLKLDTHSDAACRFIMYIPEVAALISTNLLAMFSVDRVLTVYRPLKCRGDRYLRLAIGGICGVYLASFTLNLPLVIQSGLVTHKDSSDLTKKSCQFVDSLQIGAQYALYLSILGSNIIPSAVVFISDFLIVFKLRGLFQERGRLCLNDERGAAEFRRIVGHLALTALFFVITFPIIVVIILRQQSDMNGYQISDPQYARKLVHVSRLCSSIESLTYTTGFITYFIFMNSFRIELRRLCGSHCLSMKSGNEKYHIGQNMRRVSLKPKPQTDDLMVSDEPAVKDDSSRGTCLLSLTYSVGK
ncbi:uncharacterized protein DEA37_0001355 [Paragonimus westermani]|uniref:G-protein coupled receptors family 1 profile domain-containing protein n=1 Tax=Paragonimus westermani TaxID=34504 RepID=A0A5J4NMB8_9TREM|nr:uncharacterized protein DEA37_0001355 [Paragonimus westermani]